MAHEALTSRRLAADGKTARNITVAAVELAWDEPLRPLVWLRLHGVVLAGAKAPDKVKMTDRGGVRELSVALADGSEASVVGCQERHNPRGDEGGRPGAIGRLVLSPSGTPGSPE